MMFLQSFKTLHKYLKRLTCRNKPLDAISLLKSMMKHSNYLEVMRCIERLPKLLYNQRIIKKPQSVLLLQRIIPELLKLLLLIKIGKLSSALFIKLEMIFLKKNIKNTFTHICQRP